MHQQNLTKSKEFLENMNIHKPNTMGLNKLGSSAAALAMSAMAASPTFAQNPEQQQFDEFGRPLTEPYRVADLVVDQVDCVADVRLQADGAALEGERLSRRDMKQLLSLCRLANTEAAIAAEQEVIRRLQAQIAQHQLTINEANQILNANNQLVAEIAILEGQIVLVQGERAQVQAESDQILADFEKMLLDWIS